MIASSKQIWTYSLNEAAISCYHACFLTFIFIFLGFIVRRCYQAAKINHRIRPLEFNFGRCSRSSVTPSESGFSPSRKKNCLATQLLRVTILLVLKKLKINTVSSCMLFNSKRIIWIKMHDSKYITKLNIAKLNIAKVAGN